MNPYLISLLGLAISAGPLLQAEEKSPIHWKQEVLKAGAEPDATHHTFEFEFVNRSQEPVRIVAALPHCECTTTYFDPEPVPPGKTGVIEATFHFEHRVGPQKKGISVYLDKFFTGPKNLQFEINLPQYYTMTPESLTWDPEQAQTVELAFPEIDPGQVEIEELPETFPVSASLQSGDGGSTFIIAVTPNPTAPKNLETPLNVRLRTTTDLPRLRSIPVTIKPAKAP